MRYSTEPRTRKYVKEYGLLSFAKKYKKQLMNTELKASKRVVHKAGEFMKNKIADAISTSNDDNIEKQEPIDEIIIPLEKKRKNIKQIERSIIKWDTIKYLNY